LAVVLRRTLREGNEVAEVGSQDDDSSPAAAGGRFLPPNEKIQVTDLLSSAMKRQICSYDMLAVPSRSYTVSDEEGERYFCNSRCLCLWAMMLVTKPKLPERDREQAFVMTLTDDKKRSFDTVVELASLGN
jgi:hypothetical protein